MAEYPERLGETKTLILSIAAAIAAFAGVWIAHYIIHASRQGG